MCGLGGTHSIRWFAKMDIVPRLTLLCLFLFVLFLMIRRPPRSTLDRSSAASDVYKRQDRHGGEEGDQDQEDGGQRRHVARGQERQAGGVPKGGEVIDPGQPEGCLLYTSPSPRDRTRSRMPSSA